MSGRYEREFVNALDAAGWGAVRIPTSGAATDRALPDVLAGERRDWRDHLDPIANAGTENRSHKRVTNAASKIGTLSKAIAVEHKSTSATTAYVQPDEVEALRSFAERFGATPLLAVRFTSMGTPTEHYLVAPGDARRTDAGTYGLPIDDIESRARFVLTTGDDPTLTDTRD